MTAQYQSSSTGCHVGGATDDPLAGSVPAPPQDQALTRRPGPRWPHWLTAVLTNRWRAAPPAAAQRRPAGHPRQRSSPRASTSPDTLPVVLLVYANDRVHDGRYLRNLPEERRANSAALREAEDAELIELVECTNATLSDVISACQRNRRRIIAIHIAGHADGDSLVFEQRDGSPTAAAASSFAEFLGELPALKLCFLNGCATRGHVDALLGHGVPAVVVTSTSVRDEVAQIFAYYFYSEAGRGETIADAFRHASVDTRFAFSAGQGPPSVGLWRVAGDHALPPDLVPWELHGDEAAIHERLVPVLEAAEQDAGAAESWRPSDSRRFQRAVRAQVIAGCLIALAIAAALTAAAVELLSIARVTAAAAPAPHVVGQRRDRPATAMQAIPSAGSAATGSGRALDDAASAGPPPGDARRDDQARDLGEAPPGRATHVQNPATPARRTQSSASRPGAAELHPASSPAELDRETIQRHIRSHRDELRHCYEQQLMEDPELGGTVSTRFVITAAGTVTSLTASGVDSHVSRCVAETIQGVRFPATDGTTQVNYPFRFIPRHDAAQR
jgi:hypothetical protein